MTLRWTAILGPLALATALVAFLTWPLGMHLATHLPATYSVCRVDTLLIAWALAFQSHAFATVQGLLGDANIYYPARHALFYGETGFGAVPYFMPTFLLTGNPALALNLAFLGSLALTAWALHLVVLRWTGSQPAGAIAAWTFLTARWVLWTFIPGAPNYAVLQYFPLIVFLAATPAPGAGAALLLGVAIVAQCATSPYVAAAVLAPLTILAVVRLGRHRTSGPGLRLLAIVALSVPAVLALYGGHLAMRAANPMLHRQTLWLSARPHPTVLPWGPLSPATPTGVATPALLLILLGAVVAVVRRRRGGQGPSLAWRHAAFWAVCGTLISLSPIAYWYDRRITLPHAALGGLLPIYDVIRIPDRLGVAGLVGLALLAGVAFAECEQAVSRAVHGRRRRLLCRGVLGAVLASAMYAAYVGALVIPAIGIRPLPRAYPSMPAIAPGEPVLPLLRDGRGPLLELPLPIELGRVSPTAQVQAMYRSIFHWRPLLNGYDGYWPAGFPQRMALARRLPDAVALAALRRRTGLTTILVHAGRMLPSERAAWLAAAAGERPDLRLLGRVGDDLVLTVTADGARTRPRRRRPLAACGVIVPRRS